MNAANINRIAVIGAGLMGHGIALEFAAKGYHVHLQDRGDEQLQQAQRAIAANLALLQRMNRLSPDAATSTRSRIQTGTDLRAAVAGADVVIEAVYEDLALKQAIFRDLDASAPPHTILASNTSTFMPSLLAAATRRPDRVLVAHYFNPPHLLPLVELVRGPQTSDETMATMDDLYRRLGKSPAIVQKEAPGFVGNRLQNALLREALSIVDQGIASPQDVDIIVKTGFGRRLATAGPFEIADAAGLDVYLAVAVQLFPEIASSPEVSPFLRERVERGELGLKTGQGFYPWPPEAAAALRQRIGQALTAIAELSDTTSPPPEA
jgi:3-hydroxybutyryl-CoA dehydrogenase